MGAVCVSWEDAKPTASVITPSTRPLVNARPLPAAKIPPAHDENEYYNGVHDIRKQ